MKARVRARRRRRKGIVGKQAGTGEVANEMGVGCKQDACTTLGGWIKMQKGVAEGAGRRILTSQ